MIKTPFCMKLGKTLFVAALVVVLANPAPTPAQADGKSPPAQQGGSGDAAGTPAPADSAAASDQQPQDSGRQPLKGGVRKVELTLDRLRTVNMDVKHLITASGHLYEEVTLQPVTIQTMPEVIGMGTIVPIPIGTMPAGPVEPARKSRVDLCMNQMRPVIHMFKEDVDAFMSGQRELELPDDVRKELQPYFKDWVDNVNEASQQLDKLEPLVKGPPYDQPAIADIASDIQKDGKEMQKALKKVYKIIRKEGKRLKEKAA